MRATVLYEDGTVRVDEVPDPSLRRPTDALVRVVAAAVCGSDLWRYRGITPVTEPRRMGHEFIGIVELAGAEVSSVRRGDFVVAPMNASDTSCPLVSTPRTAPGSKRARR